MFRCLILSLLATLVLSELRIDIFGIAKCPDTSKFYKQQFLPFLQYVKKVPQNVQIHYHPVSLSVNMDKNGIISNKCLHGPEECKLNKLQACTRHIFEDIYKIDPLETLTKVTCIQGRPNLASADFCVDKHRKEIFDCVNSQKGEELLFEEHHERAQFAPNSEWLPYVSFNGSQNTEAVRNFKKVVCGLEEMKDVPECAPEQKLKKH